MTMKKINKLHEDESFKELNIKFIAVYETFQKQKKLIGSTESSELIFYLEAEAVNLYFKEIVQILEILIIDEPEFYGLDTNDKKKEIYDIAQTHLLEILNSYENKDLNKLLKSISLSSTD